jgi:GT2 family glycosyltransferase
MTRSGTVSTIIPVFNRIGMMVEAVESVLAQTYRDLEVILVDDGSSEETWKTCQKLALRDERVRIRRREHAGKPGVVRETGRVLARGNYLQYLDSDDLLAPERFAKMIETLEAGGGADLAYCATRRYTAGTKPTDEPAGRTGQTFARIFPEILAEKPWFTSSVLYRREICDRAGPWSDLPFLEDVELDARMGRLGARVAHCPELLADFRDHSEGRASRQDLIERPDLVHDAVRAYSMIFAHARAVKVEATEPAMSLFMEDVRLLGSRAEKFELKEEAAVCRSMMTDVFGAETKTGLSLSAKIEPLVTELAAEPGARITCPVLVQNSSTISYRDGSWPVYLSYHLLSPSGELLQHDNRRTRFRDVLRPGQERIVDLEIEAPNQPGCYLLSIDLVLERITWFQAEGTEPGVVRFRVAAPASG